MSLFMLAAYGFACAAVYHLCPAKIRWVVLLLASYGFYASRSLAGLPFILATTGTTWLAALAIARIGESGKARLKAAEKERKKAIRAAARRRQRAVMLAALLLSLGEGGTRRTLRRLRCSNALIEEAAVLVREARRRDGSFLFGHEYGLRHPADASCFEQHSHPAGRCPNSNFLFPPLAAVVAVAGHSIARPIAFGNRVPPQRTVLRETTVTPDFTIYARRLLGKYNLCTVQRLAALGTALQPEHAADFAALSELAERLDADGVCCRVSQLAVNGRDLMAAGIPAGPGIRKVLEALLDGVIREEYPNERQALLAAVQQLAAS